MEVEARVSWLRIILLTGVYSVSGCRGISLIKIVYCQLVLVNLQLFIIKKGY